MQGRRGPTSGKKRTRPFPSSREPGAENRRGAFCEASTLWDKLEIVKSTEFRVTGKSVLLNSRSHDSVLHLMVRCWREAPLR